MEELTSMVSHFRVVELCAFLNFMGHKPNSRLKKDLMTEALNLVKDSSVEVSEKVKQLHEKRYANIKPVPSSIVSFPLLQVSSVPVSLAENREKERPSFQEGVHQSPNFTTSNPSINAKHQDVMPVSLVTVNQQTEKPPSFQDEIPEGIHQGNCGPKVTSVNPSVSAQPDRDVIPLNVACHNSRNETSSINSNLNPLANRGFLALQETETVSTSTPNMQQDNQSEVAVLEDQEINVRTDTASSQPLAHCGKRTLIAFKVSSVLLPWIQLHQQFQPQGADYQTFNFRLYPKQLRQLRNSNSGQKLRLHLRFHCRNMRSGAEFQDRHPTFCCVYVDGKTAMEIVNMHYFSSSQHNCPIDISNFVSLYLGEHRLSVCWKDDRELIYSMSLLLVKQIVTEDLLPRIPSKKFETRQTWAMINQHLKQNAQSEVEAMDLVGSLICPIGRIKMQTPCRSSKCTHFQCFDGKSFLEMNRKKPKWMCPICDKAISTADLAIDALFAEILTQVPEECKEVSFHKGHTWKPVKKENPVQTLDNLTSCLNKLDLNNLKSGTSNSKNIEYVDLADTSTDIIEIL